MVGKREWDEGIVVIARSNKRVQRSRRSEVRKIESTPRGGPLTRSPLDACTIAATGNSLL
jgi:hypothetical protein